MSLTSFIKISPVKAVFRKEFPLKQVKLEGELKAAPITRNYPLVGTAFDYMFRFYLEQKNPNCITKRWVAETSVLLMDTLGRDDEESKKMKHCLAESKKTHANFLSKGVFDDNIMKTAIILAQMDTFYRQEIVPENLGVVEDGDIQDLRNLISLVDSDLFKAKKHCFLNPTFGYGSELVGGADADLIVDDTLIDVKTTKFLSFTQEQYNQLIGYYILSKLGEINESENIPISKVGIYFSRHGVLHTIPTDQIENHPNFTKFVNWFEKSASAIFTEKLKSIS